jgi:phosphoserine phosphatase RsbU/P
MIQRIVKIILITAPVIFISVILIVFLIGNKGKSRILNIDNLTRSYVTKIEFILSSIEDIPDCIAFPLGNTTYTEEDLNDILYLVVKNNDEIYGTTCAFEPFKFYKDSVYFVPYYYKHNDNVYSKDLGGEEYNCFSWNWYLIPKRLGKPFWSEPYFDAGGGNINMITYSVPIYKYREESREFLGIITIDTSLDWINNIIGSIKLNKEDFAMLIAKSGTIISTDNNNKNWRLRETIFSLAAENKWSNFETIGNKIISGEDGSGYFTGSDGTEYLVVFKQIYNSNWTLIVAVKENII